LHARLNQQDVAIIADLHNRQLSMLSLTASSLLSVVKAEAKENN